MKALSAITTTGELGLKTSAHFLRFEINASLSLFGIESEIGKPHSCTTKHILLERTTRYICGGGEGLQLRRVPYTP